MKPSEILSAAADRLEPEGAWTRHAFARGKMGKSVISADAATCFCAVGAIEAAAGCKRIAYDQLFDVEAVAQAAEQLARSLGIFVDDIFEWNDADDRTQAEVVSALRKAAELARAEGQ